MLAENLRASELGLCYRSTIICYMGGKELSQGQVSCRDIHEKKLTVGLFKQFESKNPWAAPSSRQTNAKYRALYARFRVDVLSSERRGRYTAQLRLILSSISRTATNPAHWQIDHGRVSALAAQLCASGLYSHSPLSTRSSCRGRRVASRPRPPPPPRTYPDPSFPRLPHGIPHG